MSESGGMNVNRLTAGGQYVATDVKEDLTSLATNLRPSGSTTSMNLTWDSDDKLRSADIDANVPLRLCELRPSLGATHKGRRHGTVRRTSSPSDVSLGQSPSFFTGFNEVAGWRHVSRMARAAGMASTQPQPIVADRSEPKQSLGFR
jgi:hypothetical protein